MTRTTLLPLKRTFFPEASLSMKQLKKRLANGKTFVLVSRKGEMNGFCHTVKKGKTLWIDMLAVESSKRGRGIGGALLRRAEKYSRAKGCKVLGLFVDEHNEKAQYFYNKHGFILTDYRRDYRCYMYQKLVGEGKEV